MYSLLLCVLLCLSFTFLSTGTLSNIFQGEKYPWSPSSHTKSVPTHHSLTTHEEVVNAGVESFPTSTEAPLHSAEKKPLPSGCLPPMCRAVGSEPFGSMLGTHKGVVAYSNCASEMCISEVSNDISQKEGVPTSSSSLPFVTSFGMQWQCVEYARRYSMLRGGAEKDEKEKEGHVGVGSSFVWSFGEVDGAEDIWSLTTAVCHRRDRVVPLKKFSSGSAVEPPQYGDLLIYPRDTEFPFGHVAVVVGVHFEASPSIPLSSSAEKDEESIAGEERKSETPSKRKIGHVFVAEQNWDNKKWEAGNYSRVLSLHWIKEEGKETEQREEEKEVASNTRQSKEGGGRSRYALEDAPYRILGWLRPSDCYN